jgi:hypothetical protein
MKKENQVILYPHTAEGSRSLLVEHLSYGYAGFLCNARSQQQQQQQQQKR